MHWQVLPVQHQLPLLQATGPISPMSSYPGVFSGPPGSEQHLSAVVVKWKTVRLGLLVPSMPPCGEGLPENGRYL